MLAAIGEAARIALLRGKRGGYRVQGDRVIPVGFQGWFVSRYDQMTADFIDFGRVSE